MIHLFDSTLRDGGYINNWDFNPAKLNGIYKAANDAGIKYVEIGYLDKVNSNDIQKLDAFIFVMIDFNKKDKYIIPNKDDSNIDGIRIACHKDEVYDCISYALELKKKGFFTGIQLMGINHYLISEFGSLKDKFVGLDFISIADSNGTLLPKNTEKIINCLKGNGYLLIFHPHNNIQLAMENALVAINSGIDIIDSTFNGIGRGAGNLQTELIMSYLNRYIGYSFNIPPVLSAIEKYIIPLRGAYNWGYNVQNMLSGIYSIHPYYGRDNYNKYDSTEMYTMIKKIGDDKPMRYHGNRKIICVIPSRYKSTRFEGKPLQLINGIPLLKWVYDNATKSNAFDDVIVVTDDKKISDLCEFNNMKFMYQRTDKCRCGTDAISEISDEVYADYYINLQGDEPLIQPITIKEFVEKILSFGEIDRMAFNAMTDCITEDINNINVPKIVINAYNDLLYMSRCSIPFKKSNREPRYYKELGLHAYTKRGLEYFYDTKESPIEKLENLEFLRFIENGKNVRMIYLKLPFNNHAIDVPDDIRIVENIMNENLI